MSRAYSDLTFNPAVRAMQTRMGSRSGYASLDYTPDRRDTLTQPEIEFIQARDGCRSGTCGSCRVKVLSGRPDHRDTTLSAVERVQAGLM